MRRHFIARTMARSAVLLVLLGGLLVLQVRVAAAEQADAMGHAPRDTPLPQLRACAAFDLLLLTSIEDAGAGPDQDAVADAAFDVIDARRLCSANRFGEALEIYTRIVVEHPSEKWFR